MAYLQALIQQFWIQTFTEGVRDAEMQHKSINVREAINTASMEFETAENISR